MNQLPEHVHRNRAHWDQLAANYVSAGEHSWITNEPNWGMWSVPESEVRMFELHLDPSPFEISSRRTTNRTSGWEFSIQVRLLSKLFLPSLRAVLCRQVTTSWMKVTHCHLSGSALRCHKL
jgi:hypothetical protein